MFNVNIHDNWREYFRSVWIAVYRFWTHLILAPKLGKPGKNFFLEANMDTSRKYFSFLAYQRSVQLLYETLDTLIEALTAQSDSLSFVDRQTDKSKD